MQILPLDRLGAIEQQDASGQPLGIVDFGVLLPSITPLDGSIFVRIIHERDQFVQAVPAVEVQLSHSTIDGLGDYWSGTINIPETPAPGGSTNWGQREDQRYVYRYVLKRSGSPDIDGIIDPFAREFGVGSLSAITLGYKRFEFVEEDETRFKVPNIKDAIVYELNIAEMGGDLPKTIDLLGYIADLGVNVIEVMPVSNVAARVNWGYEPLGYFGVDERFGKRRDFQEFVAEAHQRGVAVIIDSVYGHVEKNFPYAKLYEALGKSNPFIGSYADDEFGESTDFAKSFAQRFFFTVNVHWLDAFRIDGFRYDAVQQYWDESRPSGQQGFSELAVATFDHVQAQSETDIRYARFFASNGGSSEIRLIQIAEFLRDPPHVLSATLSNSTWQNTTLDAARNCARGTDGAISQLGRALGLVGFPEQVPQNGTVISKSALQYIENHDHERFICNFGVFFPEGRNEDPLLQVGDRAGRWFKVQPYLIGLMMAKGTPLLWQGQEICQNYFVPPFGSDIDGGRTPIFRPVDFNLFYDSIGRTLIHLVRNLTRMRRNNAQFTEGDHFFYNQPEYNNQGLLLFSRSLDGTFSLVALNFTDQDKTAIFRFPQSGNYTEELEGQRNLSSVQANAPTSLTVPSNYGCVWTISNAG